MKSAIQKSLPGKTNSKIEKSGRQSFDNPFCISQPVPDSVMKSVGSALPEFKTIGSDEIATPAVW